MEPMDAALRTIRATVDELTAKHSEAMSILATDTAQSSQMWATVLSKLDQLESSQKILTQRVDNLSNHVSTGRHN